MADRLVAVDDGTYLFPEPVRAAYEADVQAKISTAVSNFDGVATAVANKVTPLVTDGLVNPLLASATATRDAMDARFRTATVIRVGTSTSADYTSVVQAALNEGQDVEIVGPATGSGICKISAVLLMNANASGQRLTTRNAAIQPTHRGDAVQVTTKSVVSVVINGALQPSTGDFSEVAAIRIGGSTGNYNPQQAAITYCDIRNWNGNGIIWEHGAVIPFTQTYISDVTYDGIRATANYDDNNHGLFENTHIVRAARRGYSILYGSSTYTTPYNGGYASAAHEFVNAKAFGCGQNFHIETHSNVGNVFSEAGVSPDTFAATSRSNLMVWTGTVTAAEGLVDNAPAFSNEIIKNANGDYRVHQSLRVRAFQIGTAQLTSGLAGRYSTGDVSVPPNTVAAISPGITGLGDGRVIQVTGFTGSSSGIILTGYIDGGGIVRFQLFNTTSSAKTYNGTISYLIFTFV